MGRRTILTPELEDAIVKPIEDGAFDWVAAENAGISKTTFYNWMRAGENGNPKYVAFVSRVRRARARARMKAEIEVRKQDPFKWLRYGPGRDKPGEPGWTESQQVEVTGNDDAPVIINMRLVDEKAKV